MKEKEEAQVKPAGLDWNDLDKEAPEDDFLEGLEEQPKACLLDDPGCEACQ